MGRLFYLLRWRHAMLVSLPWPVSLLQGVMKAQGHLVQTVHIHQMSRVSNGEGRESLMGLAGRVWAEAGDEPDKHLSSDLITRDF